MIQNPAKLFIHVDSGDFWYVSDPVLWALNNKDQPVIERAAEALSRRNKEDAEQILKIVVRRCSLNFIEIQGPNIIVHFWTRKADLRTFFREHKLNTFQTIIQLWDRKKDIRTTITGDEFWSFFKIFCRMIETIWFFFRLATNHYSIGHSNLPNLNILSRSISIFKEE